MYTFSPNTKIESAKVNQNFTDVQNGDSDVDNGNLLLFRGEILRDFAASGLNWSVVTGLQGAMTAGVAYIKDSNNKTQRVDVALTNKTFTASKDTYVMLDATGAITYNEQTIGTIPTYAANTMPLAKVTTDASNITGLTLLAPRNPDEIARATILIETDNIILPNIPSYRYLDIDLHTVDSGAISLTMRVNGDTGSSYGVRRSANGAADSTPGAATSIDFGTGSAADSISANLQLINYATEEKTINGSVYRANGAGAATAPSKIEVTAKWANASTQANRIDLINTGAGNYGIDSQIIVRGRN